MNKKTIKKYAKEHKCSIREAQRQLGLEATGNMSVLSSPKGEDIIKEEVFDINDDNVPPGTYSNPSTAYAFV